MTVNLKIKKHIQKFEKLVLNKSCNMLKMVGKILHANMPNLFLIEFANFCIGFLKFNKKIILPIYLTEQNNFFQFHIFQKSINNFSKCR